MFAPQPTEQDKESVEMEVRAFSTALVPSPALFRTLEEQGMEQEMVVACLNELEIEDRVWCALIPEENGHDLPSGEHFYIPSNSQE